MKRRSFFKRKELHPQQCHIVTEHLGKGTHIFTWKFSTRLVTLTRLSTIHTGKHYIVCNKLSSQLLNTRVINKFEEYKVDKDMTKYLSQIDPQIAGKKYEI